MFLGDVPCCEDTEVVGDESCRDKEILHPGLGEGRSPEMVRDEVWVDQRTGPEVSVPVSLRTSGPRTGV